MKYKTSDFIRFYNEYRKIQRLYCGDKTDFKTIYDKLYSLEIKIKDAHDVRNDETAYFNEWTRKNLLNMVGNELTRIIKFL